MRLGYGLRLPTDVRFVTVVRRLCVATLTELRVERSCIDDIALAVTEACANVVQHAGTHEDFEVRVSVEGSERGSVCRIEVVDAGGGIDAARTTGLVLDSDDPLTHGRGIGLMRILVDQLHFVPDEEGTTVVLVKNLDLLPGSALVEPEPSPAG